MNDNITDEGFGKSDGVNSETNRLGCNSSEHYSAAVSDSGDEDVPIVRSKKRVQQFSDSDVDSSADESQNEIPNVVYASSDTESKLSKESLSELPENPNVRSSICDPDTTDEEGSMVRAISKRKKESKSVKLTSPIDSDDDISNDDMNKSSHISRLRKVSTSSHGDNVDSNDGEIVTCKSPGNGNDNQDSRIKNKRDKLREKFKSLVTKRLKENESGSDSDSNKADKITSEASQSSEDEASSVNEIKQKIKEKTFQMKSSICDPDTSDEEGTMARAISKPKKERKSVKPTSPKPIRMSAKQAMENMQKIKSESNRMLREKEVSLPYHRPKALSLKDILSKRRPAVSADGKTLPIKMNEEQLRQYAQQLEQRQKEVIELCRSESEDEPDEPKENNDTETDKENKSQKENINDKEMEALNDTIYDDLSKTETTIDTYVEDNIKDTKTNSDEHVVTENSTDVEKMDVDEEELKQLEMDKSEPEGDYVNSTSLDRDKNTTSIIETETDNDNGRNNSADMELVYNDSVEEPGVVDTDIERSKNIAPANELAEPNTEVDSQLISLNYDNTEKIDDSENLALLETETHGKTSNTVNNEITSLNGDFSDDDMNMDDIDALIENAEISTNHKNSAYVNSPMLIKEHDLTAKPKLTGAPGMVIDLDGTDPLVPRKLTGVELLKERFVFFAKLKTPEERERENEKTVKPGALHLKLKQELEEQIAEQRSLEWAKRLEEEKQHKAHESVKKVESDNEDIDDIEANLKEEEEHEKESSSESEEEEIEHDVIDKPRKRNPMVDDEAEESDCDEIPENEDGDEVDEQALEEGNEAGVEDNNDEDETESSSDESEEEQETVLKKGRILKAFEDSDDEDKLVPNETVNIEKTDPESNSKLLKDTQDDVIQLAQKSQSEDLFTSQDSKATKSSKVDIENTQGGSCFSDKDLGTQTFSILERPDKENVVIDFPIPDKLPMTCDTQAFDDNLDAVVEMCSGSFSQNLVPPSQMYDVPASQVIGEDVLALCTGQFYDNQFVSQDNIDNSEVLPTDKSETLTFAVAMSPKESYEGNSEAMPINKDELISTDKTSSNSETESNRKTVEDSNLKSILDELNDPEFDSPKPNKYFVSNMEGKENNTSVANAQFKKKFVIDSDDDERTEDVESSKNLKNKKKKKMKQRALQISDDEEDEETDEEDEFESEEVEEDEEQIVEYDSDENEVIVQPQNPKKKRKTAEFFENEAELTSEDEWIGSGDEDEAGLDRMEREAGDEDTFNQNQLQRELGQIHMRDVLDQDKREVRMIQELLFEDGDLGAGSRQRKFRWKDIDGEDEDGTGADEFADTQEDEAESEEQWRKQRHEREMFLRSLNKEDATTETISFNRTSFIKANLSKNCSNVSIEVNTSVEKIESPAPEKKTAKDIPSPKKPFPVFQQKYHGSLLARGQDALARLAALATPLATDDCDAPKGGSLAPSNKRNFVFATVDTTKDDEPKVIKRKAEATVGTPRLVKRLRTEDKQKHSKASLLDHLKA